MRATATPRDDLVQRLRSQADTGARVSQPMAVHPALTGLLDGGLQPGAAYSVDGGALLLALLAEPSGSGLWCGVVGIPELGAEAARSAGVVLDRLVLVPKPGERWLSVVASLAEALPIVAVRPPSPVRDGDAARLAARLRERSSVLLVCGDWPRGAAELRITRAQWSGLGAGHGYLCGREVTVSVTSRHSGMPRTARMLLPDANGRLAAGEVSVVEVSRRPRLRAVG
ncbi:MAG: hypothetical protein GX875_02220 [Propionibacterium sp.]|nr:hypothetical protein [Propionibacterium sp.]